MKKFDLPTFLNKFYHSSKINNFYKKKLWTCLKILYGINLYSSLEIFNLFGFNKYISIKYINIYIWTNIFFYLKFNFNFFLYDLKLKNVKRIRNTKTHKGWRHIFNLPVRGQRSHTNAKTRKKFHIF